MKLHSILYNPHASYIRLPKMKVVAVLLSFLAVLADHHQPKIRRGLLGGIYGQEQRHHVDKGKAVEGKSRVVYPERSVDNHHNIPRQNYNDWGGASSSSGDSGDNSEGGTG
ncbi:hypothetical protein Ddye_011142 [Dipteronia dyeriana]|uniref:Uncharacterized protein n=1 Tax=Dipteronia dyeriana TaxID=168575 RepID=A0AAE0CNU7_9ROSI|nr:hypothetical protein Ddye_011142 [Dipteronia dyeriana]